MTPGEKAYRDHWDEIRQCNGTWWEVEPVWVKRAWEEYAERQAERLSHWNEAIENYAVNLSFTPRTVNRTDAAT